MSLEALLTFFGILVAILALARPVQRHSLMLYAPPWRISLALVLSFALIVCRDAPLGIRPPFNWPLTKVLFGLTLGSFVIPVLAALWSWVSWHRAKLSCRRIKRVENIFLAALREREFDEVERIVRKNRQRLKRLPPRASSALFKPEMIKALADSHPFLHLELLADLKLLDSLENRHGAIGAVVRELLRSEESPLRAAVIDRYGGLEHNVYSSEQRALIEKTFQNPEWYLQTSAHYPLVISATEALRSGKFDVEYNSSGRDYEATQGTSRRASCPIYLAVGTEALAIEAALGQRVEQDFYSTDLFQIFVAVQEVSKFDEQVWNDPRNNHEFPTPFAYLLYTIASHLEDLARVAIRQATSAASPSEIGAPGAVAEQIVRSWSVCVWSIADSVQEVSPIFRRSIIRQYLVFMLQLGWGISEVYLGPVPSNIADLNMWRDLFLAKLKSMLHLSDHVRSSALQEAVKSLDQGKGYVANGYEWLQNSLAN